MGDGGEADGGVCGTDGNVGEGDVDGEVLVAEGVGEVGCGGYEGGGRGHGGDIVGPELGACFFAGRGEVVDVGNVEVDGGTGREGACGGGIAEEGLEVVAEDFTGPSVHDAVESCPDYVGCIGFCDKRVPGGRLTGCHPDCTIFGAVLCEVVAMLPDHGGFGNDGLDLVVESGKPGTESWVAVMDRLEGLTRQ